MISKLIWIAVISALFSAAFKFAFPKARHWLAILIAAVLFPLVSAVLTVYRMLIEVGLSANGGDSAPPGTIDKFASGMNSLMVFVPVAVILAALTSLAVLRFLTNRRSS